eukprot:1895276-Karenia_brevis.AAC.1
MAPPSGGQEAEDIIAMVKALPEEIISTTCDGCCEESISTLSDTYRPVKMYMLYLTECQGWCPSPLNYLRVQ